MTIPIIKEDLIEDLNTYPTQQAIAEKYGCTQGTISNKIKLFGLTKLIPKTERDPKIEYPAMTWDKTKEILLTIEEQNSPSVGYEEVDIDIETKSKICIVPIMDLHAGSRYTYSTEFIELVEFIVENPQVFTGFNGDLADNYNTSAYKAGQIEQRIDIQRQKSIVENIIKELSGNILWFINGCHDEWSYLNDGFDLAQYLAHKDQQGYYLGHHGRVNLTVGDICYKIFNIHNTFRGSSLNDGHGLRWICREHWGYDIAVKGHDHRPYVESFFMRRKPRYTMGGRAWKGQDRHGSKKGYPPVGDTTPGFLLEPKKKKVILAMNYKDLVKYL